MPDDKESDRKDKDKSRIAKNFVLLALPWLSFQRDVLALMKRGIEDTSHVRPLENLASRELQALMMTLDPSGKWRSLLDRDLQNEIKESYTKNFPKLVAGALGLIETQEQILASLTEMFETLRKDNNLSGDKRGKTLDQPGR